MNAWFTQTFLPSLFERIGANKALWLSQKQTAICTKYMEQHIATVQLDVVSTGRHNFYTCKWQGRNVTLDYSKKNACGCIKFSFTEEEIAIYQQEHEKEEKAKKIEFYRSMKASRPEKYAKRLKEQREKVNRYKEDIAYALADKSYDSEEERAEDIDFYNEKINELIEKIKIMTA